MDTRKAKIIELNVGGQSYATTLGTLTQDPASLLAQYFSSAINLSDSIPAASGGASSQSLSSSPNPATTPVTSPMAGQPMTNDIASIIQCRADGIYFIDRDGDLFRYVLDYLRTGKILVPENFQDMPRLREEAKFYKIAELIKQLKPGPSTRRGTAFGAVLPSLVNGASNNNVNSGNAGSSNNYGYVTVGYRGTFAFGRDGQADVKFRKLSRIIVCGRASLCREVFGDTLNESRDPDRGGENRYTARLYLKHSILELAFDMLAERGFDLITSCASGTCASGDLMRGSAADSEEQKWNHYNEFVFYRPPP